MGIYYSNTWNVSLAVFRLQKNPMVTCYVSQSLAFPMLSSSIFSANGSVYHQSAVFGTTFTLNQTALQEVGLPALTGEQILKFICEESWGWLRGTGSNAWANLTANLSVSHLDILLVAYVIWQLLLPDWGFDCTLPALLETLCHNLFQASAKRNSAWSSLAGTVLLLSISCHTTFLNQLFTLFRQCKGIQRFPGIGTEPSLSYLSLLVR